MRLLEVHVVHRNHHLAVVKEQNVQSEFLSVRLREPNTAGLFLISQAVPEAGDVRPQQGANCQWNLARQLGVNINRFKVVGVDVGLARPIQILLVGRLEADALRVVSLECLSSFDFEDVLFKLLAGKRNQVLSNPVFRLRLDQVLAHVIHQLGVEVVGIRNGLSRELLI